MAMSLRPTSFRVRAASLAVSGLLLFLFAPSCQLFATTRLEETRHHLDSLAVQQDLQRESLQKLAGEERSGVQRLEQLEKQGVARRTLRGQLAAELGLLESSRILEARELEVCRTDLDSLSEARVSAGANRERIRAETAALARRLFPLRHMEALAAVFQSDSLDQVRRNLRRLPWLRRSLQRRLAELAGLDQHLEALVTAQARAASGHQESLARLDHSRKRTRQAGDEATAELHKLELEQREQGRLLQSLRQDKELALAQTERLRRAGDEVGRQLEDLQSRWSEREARRVTESRRQSSVSQRLAAIEPGTGVVAQPETRPRPDLPRKEVAAQGHAPEPQGGLGPLRGRLPAPVAGRVSRTFGEQRDPQLGTVLDNPGLDYSCRPGAPVSAVHAGRVEKITWVAGFGNTMLIAHGQGTWTVYAKLEDVAVREGQAVGTGQLLGRAGCLDSPDQGSLHFELWQGEHAQNPLDWLKH